MRPDRRHLGGAAGIAALAVVVTWPLVLGGGAIGHPTGDMPDHCWGTWWFGREVLAGRFPITTDITHFPEQMRLWYVDPVGAVLALVFRPLGFPAAWNAALFAQVLAAAAVAYAAAFDLLRDRAAALFGAIVVAGSPYALGLLHSGLAEYLGLAWPVAATWALLRALGLDPRGRPPFRGAAVAAGLLLVGATVQAFYYGAFGVLVAACLLPGPGWRGRLGPLARAGAVYAALAGPFMAAVWTTLRGGDAAVGEHNAPGWEQLELPAVDLLTWVVPGGYRFPDTVAHGNPGILQVNYLGWVALALAGLGLWRAAAIRPLRLPFALVGLFALGPRLAFLRRTFAAGSVPLYLPLALLYLPGSPFRMVHHPYRFTAWLLFPMALAGGAALARLPAWARALVPLCALAEALLLSPAEWPLAVTPIEPPAVELGGPRLDWPADATTWNRRYLLWQVRHEQPIAYGVNVFLDEDLRRDPLVRRLVYAFDDPLARARNRDVEYRGRVLLPAEDGQTRLAQMGFRAIVVHRAGLSATEEPRTRAILEEAFGAAVSETEALSVWDPTAGPAAPRRRGRAGR